MAAAGRVVEMAMLPLGKHRSPREDGTSCEWVEVEGGGVRMWDCKYGG